METIEQRQGKRLREARKAAGYDSARSAALEHGWPEATYRAHEGGWRTIGRDDAERYTRAFRARGSKITAESVLFPDGKPKAEPDGEYRRGWDAAMQAVATAAGAGNIQAPAPPGVKRAKKKPKKK